MQIKIRRAQREDASALFALARQYITGRAAIGYEEFSIAFDNVLKYREQETNVAFVAVDKSTETLIGYTLTTVSRLLHAAGLTAHLQEIVVDEPFRSQGIGELLIKSVETYCRARGVKQISASTARIGSFFDHLDFNQVGQHYSKLLT